MAVETNSEVHTIDAPVGATHTQKFIGLLRRRFYAVAFLAACVPAVSSAQEEEPPPPPEDSPVRAPEFSGTKNIAAKEKDAEKFPPRFDRMVDELEDLEARPSEDITTWEKSREKLLIRSLVQEGPITVRYLLDSRHRYKRYDNFLVSTKIIDAFGEEAVSALSESFFREESGFTHYRSRSFLGKLGPRAKAIVPRLIECLKREENHTDCLRLLEKIGPDAGEAAEVVAELLKTGKGDIPYLALETLEKMGPKAKSAIPLIVERAKDRNYTSYRALRVLQSMGSDAEEAVPALREMLKDPEHRYPEDVLKTLGAIGHKAKEALPDLFFHLEQSYEDWMKDGGFDEKSISFQLGYNTRAYYWFSMQREAYSALGNIAPEHPDVLSTLEKGLFGKQNTAPVSYRGRNSRNGAARGIVSLGEKAAPLAPRLLRSLTHYGWMEECGYSEQYVRQKEEEKNGKVENTESSWDPDFSAKYYGYKDNRYLFMEALVNISPSHPDVLPIVYGGLLDPERANDSIWMLSRIGKKYPEKVIPELFAHLLGWYGVNFYKDYPTGKEAAKAYERMQKEEKAILDAFGEMGSEGRKVLFALLRSSQPINNLSLAEAFRLSGEEAVQPLLKELQRSGGARYRAALALGALGDLAKPEIASNLKGMKWESADKNPSSRRSVFALLEAVGYRGSEDQEVVEHLATIIKTTTRQPLRQRAVSALVSCRWFAGDQIQDILLEGNGEAQYYLLSALLKTHAPIEKLIPMEKFLPKALTVLRGEQTTAYQRVFISALGKSIQKEHLPILLKPLREHPEEFLYCNRILSVLQKMGRNAEGAIPTLVELYDKEIVGSDTQELILDAVGSTGMTHDNTAVNLLRQGLSNDFAEVREAAALAFAELVEHAEKESTDPKRIDGFMEVLDDIAGDREEIFSVRQAAAIAHAKIWDVRFGKQPKIQ